MGNNKRTRDDRWFEKQLEDPEVRAAYDAERDWETVFAAMHDYDDDCIPLPAMQAQIRLQKRMERLEAVVRRLELTAAEWDQALKQIVEASDD